MPPDVYATPDAPDPVLNQDQIQELVGPCVPTAGRLLRVDESGGEARVYLLAGDVVVKVQRPHRRRARTSLAKERAILQALASVEAVRVPSVLGHGHQSGIDYLVMTRMEGVPLSRLAVEGDERQSVLRALGEMLRHLHQVAYGSVKMPDGENLPADGNTGAIRERLDERAAPYLAVLGSEWRQRWECALRDLPDVSGRSLVHSNPGPPHVFVQAAGSLAGLIDFGDAYVSDPALDLWRFGHPRDRRHLMEGYERLGPVGTETRALWQRVMFLADLGILANHQAWAHEAQEDIAELGF